MVNQEQTDKQKYEKKKNNCKKFKWQTGEIAYEMIWKWLRRGNLKRVAK